MLERLAERIKSGELSGISAVPTSDKTEAELHRLGIPCLKARHCLDALLDALLDGWHPPASRLPNPLPQGGGRSALCRRTPPSSRPQAESTASIDLAIGSADAVDRDRNVVKGGKGSLAAERGSSRR